MLKERKNEALKQGYIEHILMEEDENAIPVEERTPLNFAKLDSEAVQ
jgi:hypothetical protein